MVISCGYLRENYTTIFSSHSLRKMLYKPDFAEEGVEVQKDEVTYIPCFMSEGEFR